MTTDGLGFSVDLSIPTTPPAPPRKFGDTVGSFVAGEWTAPEGIVTTNDIVAAVKKFGLDPDAALLARLDTDGAVPNATDGGPSGGCRLSRQASGRHNRHRDPRF